MDTVNFILEKRIIAIVRGVFGEDCIRLAEALHRGGIHLIEVTFDQAHPESFEKTADAIRIIGEHFGGKVIPGAGTVVTEKQVETAAGAGARYIISPNTDLTVIRKTKQLGLISMPGALTPSEIMAAYNAGADFVKVFPAANFGPAYLKAIRAPISHVRLMAVGGINDQNAAEYLQAGAVGIGVGGNLVNKEWIAEGRFDVITVLAEKYVETIRSGRGQ